MGYAYYRGRGTAISIATADSQTCFRNHFQGTSCRSLAVASESTKGPHIRAVYVMLQKTDIDCRHTRGNDGQGLWYSYHWRLKTCCRRKPNTGDKLHGTTLITVITAPLLIKNSVPTTGNPRSNTSRTKRLEVDLGAQVGHQDCSLVASTWPHFALPTAF